MRILDEQGQEITLEEVDFNLGWLKNEEIVQNIPELTHYMVGRFYFEDGTSYTPIGEDDPHIEIINAEKGNFKYVPQNEEEPKQVRGMDIKLIVDQKARTITEDIQRYILYTKEELIQRELPQRVSAAEKAIEETDITIEDLILLMAEVLGGEEELPEEEEEPLE